MAQWKGVCFVALATKYDPSLNPSYHVHKLGTTACTSNTTRERQREEDSRGLLGRQCDRSASSRFRESISNNK